VRKWSPFDQTDYAVHWSGAKASVYAWDKSAASSDITSSGLNPKRCEVLPETFIRTPLKIGFRLVKAIDGYEGQHWRNGQIRASRWWNDIPKPRDVQLFLRGAGASFDASNPQYQTVENPDFLEAPWTADTRSVNDIWSLLQTERIAAIAATVVAVPFLYFIGQIVALSVSVGGAQAEMDELSGTNQAVRAERSSALSNLDAVESYLTFERYPSQFEIIVAASEILEDKGITISEWIYDNGSLELGIESMSVLDSTYYIEEFEKAPMFANVRGSSGVQQQSLRLNITVLPKEWPVQ